MTHNGHCKLNVTYNSIGKEKLLKKCLPDGTANLGLEDCHIIKPFFLLFFLFRTSYNVVYTNSMPENDLLEIILKPCLLKFFQG